MDDNKKHVHTYGEIYKPPSRLGSNISIDIPPEIQWRWYHWIEVLIKAPIVLTILAGLIYLPFKWLDNIIQIYGFSVTAAVLLGLVCLLFVMQEY